MALATFRNTDTGELIELHEDWLTRFPKDPYVRVEDDDLATLETKQREADIAALGAQPFDQQQETLTETTPAPAPAPEGDADGDTPAPSTDPRDARRF